MKYPIITCCLLSVLLIEIGLSSVSNAQPQRLYRTTMSFTPIRNGAAVVAIRLSDKVVGNFLFDSGTNYSMLSEKMVTKLGLTRQPYLKEDGGVVTMEGRPAKLATVPLVQMGELQFANLNFMIVRQQLLRELTDIAPEQSIDGIIGGDFYYSIATIFDFPRHQITVWSGGKLTEEDLKGIQLSDMAPIAIEKDEHDTFYNVRVRINGRQEEKLRIDTGAAYTSLSARLVHSLRLKPTV